MAGKIAWPDDTDILELIQKHGTKRAAAEALGVASTTFKDHLKRRGLFAQAEALLQTPPPAARAHGVTVGEGEVTVTLPESEGAALGDYGDLLRQRGLDPEDWVVVSVKANKWNAMTSDKETGANQIVEMHQWTISLRPALHKLLAAPAVHVPRVKRTGPGPAPSEKPVTIVVEGDHQFPYHDQRLHEASVAMLRDLSRKYRLSEQVFLGDSGDFPTISRHDDHPAAMAPVNAVLQCTYDRFREKRDAAPNIRVRKILGNHDWRLESELLKRCERMYGITPAQRDGQELEIPALHLNRLLHLPELGIELVESRRGWQHGEIELVSGPRGLVVRHGWLTGSNTAERSLVKRGRSIIVGHIHRREQVFVWDPSMECERIGVVAGTMSMVRGGRDAEGNDAETFPNFAPLDNWLQGCVIVTKWPDGDFCAEHAKFVDGKLRWRDHTWVG